MQEISRRKQKHQQRHFVQKIKKAEAEEAAVLNTVRPKAKKSASSIDAVFMRGIKGSDPILETPFPQIAFVGRSNVGKSSTINVLLGVAGLARTSARPGKTQEINFYKVNDNMFFVDLPGYGYARLPQKDAERIRKHILWYLAGGESRPELVILIIDARIGVTSHDHELMRVVEEEGHPFLLLMNKIDKLNANERRIQLKEFAEEFPDVDFIPFSAKTKEGLSEVRARIFAKGKK